MSTLQTTPHATTDELIAYSQAWRAEYMPHTIAPVALGNIPGFFDYLFGQRAGWACLGWIDGDPLIEEIDGDHQEWYKLPQDRETMERRAAWHADQGHNLYVRHALFSKRSGTKKNALPSDILWQDDTRDDTPASVLIESSKGNYQALIKLDRLATTPERKRMMTAWRNARPGADDCSANPVAFVRVPGGHNRKRHGDWLVRYAMRSDRVYTADKLLARCGAGKGETHSSSAALGALDRAKLDYWQTHIDQLLNDDRTLPRAFVRDTPGRRILELRALGKGMLFHNSGTWDASRERLWLANSLVMARYLDEQIAALLWHFEVAETIEIKGETAVWADISRVLGMARLAHPNIHPRLYGARPAKAPKIARGRASSHAQTVEQVYSLLLDHKAEADVIIHIADIATAIGAHRGTVTRILIELRGDEEKGIPARIITRRLAGGGGLVVTFPEPKRDVIIDAVPAVALPIAAPETSAPVAALGETGSQGKCVSPDRANADHISEPPTLETAIGEALDALLGERANNRTGEVQTWPRTNKRIVAWLEAHYPEAWPQWERFAPRQIARVRKLRRNTVFNEIRDMPAKALEHAHAGCARTIAKYEKCAKLETDPAIRASWEREANKRRGRLALLGQERAAREQAEAKRIERIGYSLTEQAEMLALVDQVRPERPRIGRAAHLVEPPLPPAPDGWAAIARLQAAAADRQQVQL